jgi:GDP-L-fucose synthase
MSMKILITGAAGFLGRHFYAYHAARGDEIVAVDDLSNADEPPFPIICVDAGAYFKSERMHFARAYHFAAPVGGRLKIDQDPMFNADSLRLDSMFFRWAISHTNLAVYPSSSAVYPTMHQTADNFYPLREDHVDPANSVVGTPDQVYGWTKLTGEYLAWRAASYGLNTLCIRPFSGYGEGQSFDYPFPSIIRRALRLDDPISVWGPGTQTRDFIHVEDVVRGTMARIESGIRGYRTMNLGTGVGTSFVELAQRAALARGYQPQILTDPSKPVGVMHRVADVTEMNAYYTPTISLDDGIRRVMEDINCAPDR